jgi:DNA-binding winged helix-turn-helix (wHTH) protein/tetratricopeptide (TPR) repeat protein
MDQRSPIEGRYRFGPFLLDPSERLVTREGAPVALTTRLFELLLAFVRSPGVLLTKSDLMDAVWPDRVVDEGSLTQAIFSLRKALDDGGDDGRYITTVTGRGYSFSAPVENIGAAPRVDARREALSSAPAATLETTPVVAQPGKRRPQLLYLLAGAVTFVIVGAAFFFWPRSAPVPVKPLVVVVSDFQNLSNNPLFDRTFTTAAKSALQQSPRLSVLSDGIVADTLDLMTRSKDARLTPRLAQEVCARNNGQAAISGTIAQVGANYLLTLTATDCVDSHVIWTNKAEVGSLDALLPALDRLVEGVRQKLGESADSIEKFNVPVLKQRTASFEALMAYSEAHYDFNHGKYIEAIPLFQRAIEIDPNFAAAYDGLSTTYSNTHETRLDIANITKAYALRDHASELEKLHILMRYNYSVLGDIDETIRVLKAWTELYPDDASAWVNLANQEVWLGENAAAIGDGQHALSLNPGMENAYVVLATAYLHSGDLGHAAAICAQSVSRHLDGFGTHRLTYAIASLHHDDAAMQRELAWASGKPAERFMLIEALQSAYRAGQVRRALEMSARALQLGKEMGLQNFMAAPNARTLNDLGYRDQALQFLDQVPAGYDSGDYRFDLLTFGDEAQGAALLKADLAKSPSDTLLNEDFAPEERAALALRHNQPSEAVKAMALPSGLIETHTFDATYVRGEAYLAAGDAPNAAMEFRKITDHPALDPVSPLYPLAWLGLARALHKEGRIDESRAAYQKLFVLWKDADKDLPVLQDATHEFASFSPS